ncbi:MAG: Gamma-glutamyltranspeptidase [Myxococcales bacterium]|nr:Gamma-glutamyltranspeptidase [Myxococcales bacterium]
MSPRRLAVAVALVALAGACKKSHAPGKHKDTKPVAGEAAAKFRTDPNAFHVDPAFTGTGKTFMVDSESDLATKVGHDVLLAGGNAADAAVATAFALAVVHPTAGNLAGGGFAIVRPVKGPENALDFREVAPAAATADMFLDDKGKPTKDSITSDRASGVPGSVAGLWELHKKYGKTPWKDLIAPAQKLARDGFVVDPYLHAMIERRGQLLAANPASAALWMPGGKPIAKDALVKLPELAAVLDRIADSGPPGFYTGPTAAAIVEEMKHGGGLITADDLKSYKAVWREPLRFDYRGKHVISMPPPSSGGIVLAMTANMLRAQDLGKMGWHSVDHVHWLVEVWRRAYAARNEILGDPAFVKTMPLDKLLSQDYADKLVATIGPKATPSKDVMALIEGNHTTNLCVVDGQGMAIALTTTLNTAFGNGVTVSGFLLNNEMDDFTAKPGSPNVYGLRQGAANKIEPGKRMLSSMSPTIIEDEKGELFMVLGAQGGPKIITAVWQTLSNVIDFGFAVDAAVAAPRIHHQHLPDQVDVEAEALTREVDEGLRALGYLLDWSKSPREFADANAILHTKAGWQGAIDPRGAGAALGD